MALHFIKYACHISKVFFALGNVFKVSLCSAAAVCFVVFCSVLIYKISVRIYVVAAQSFNNAAYRITISGKIVVFKHRLIRHCSMSEINTALQCINAGKPVVNTIVSKPCLCKNFLLYRLSLLFVFYISSNVKLCFFVCAVVCAGCFCRIFLFCIFCNIKAHCKTSYILAAALRVSFLFLLFNILCAACKIAKINTCCSVGINSTAVNKKIK